MGNDVSPQNVACGDVDEHSRSGIIMKSSYSLHGPQSTHDCHNAERLNVTLRKELPVFDLAQNTTYRSIACARCNSKGNFSYWGLNISCERAGGSIATPINITVVKRFLNEYPDCSWKYKPRNLDQRDNTRSCVLRDTRCASNHLSVLVLSVVKELCALYSMAFSIGNKLSYRNLHCTFCYPLEDR